MHNQFRSLTRGQTSEFSILALSSSLRVRNQPPPIFFVIPFTLFSKSSKKNDLPLFSRPYRVNAFFLPYTNKVPYSLVAPSTRQNRVKKKSGRKQLHPQEKVASCTRLIYISLIIFLFFPWERKRDLLTFDFSLLFLTPPPLS